MSKLFQQLFSKSKTLVFIFSFFLGGQIWGQCNVTISATSPLCYGDTTGVLQATVNTSCGCPTSVYFRLKNPSNVVIQTSLLVNGLSYTFNNLPALPSGQSYSVEVSQNTSFGQNDICASGGASLVDNSQIYISAQSLTNVLCNGESTGSISITPSGGFIGQFGHLCRGYNLTWTGPTPPPTNFGLICPPEMSSAPYNYQMQNLVAGTYQITVADFNGCQATTTQIITQPDSIFPVITTTNATCATGAGSIVVGGLNGQDGTPSNVGFNISWQLTGAAINNPAGIEIQAPGFLNYTIPQAPTYPLLVPGIYAITIIDNNGCVNSSQQTINFTNPSPIISGNTQMCTGTTQQLSISNNQPPVAGNAWSSSNSNVISVNASTGVVTAAAPGSATITFTSLSGCTGTFTITVNATPTFTLSNPPTLCAGQTASITATSTPNIYNYVWNTLPVTTQNAVSTSSVTVSPGSNTIYTATATNATTGCSASQNTTVTVNPLPVISGGTFICVNAQSQLTGTATAANNNAWVSNNTGVATISATGLVSALSIGTAQITYTNSLGCSNSVTVNVVAFPVITGPSAVCLGSTIQLSGTGTAASWASSNQSVATVNSTGLVSGISVGNTTITYITNTGCQNTTPISVNPVPTITGLNSVCVNNTITLTGSGTAAAWSSSNNSIATVSSIGVVTGVSAGTVSVIYTNNFGCNASTTVTVNANPIITGSNALCLNGTLQLNGNGTAAANNPWVSSNTGVATISNSGLITGISVGTSNITYTNLAGCSSSLTITVNANPTISGNIPLCVGQTNNLIGSGTPNTSTPWSSSAPLIASVTNLGVITALAPGQTTITYTSDLGCIKTVLVQVNANPSISGNLSLCVNATSQLTGSASAATNTPWISSNTGVATISASGLVTAVTAGNTTITYTNSNGCQVTALVSVYANPTITGNTSLCVGSTLTLTGNGTAAASNAWISSNTAVATVTNLGVVTGVAAGTTTITYTNSNNCLVTSTVTVNALPTVTGNTSLCIGATSQLTGSPTASNWVSNAVGIATVSNTGLINAVSAGSATITYTNTTGCTVVVPVTVFANPTITGGVSLCVSSTLQLTGSGTAAAANSWASSNTAVATISNAGLVTAVSAGTTTITYTNNNNCSVTSTVTVNALPTVTGNNTLCAGTSTSLTGSPTPAVTTPWSSSNAGIASITNGGVVNGVTAGSVVITYTNSVGCVANFNLTVNATTIPIFSQLGPYCVNGNTGTLPLTSNNGSIAGTWSPAAISTTTAGTSVYTFTPTSTAPNTCAINTTMSVVVTTLPSATIGASALSVCQNSAQPNITFSGSNSSPPYSFTYNINDGVNQTITTSGTSSTVTLPAPTSTTGAFTYTLTSVAVGSCSNPISNNNTATITVSPNLTPTFNQVGPYCNGQSIPALPTTSTNSISGTWAPAINNIAISSAVTTNYTFTPTSGPGICATTANMPIVVNPNTTPLFTQLGPYCQGATPDAFPTTSNNGIAGSWSPATISTASPGSTPYTFTPTSAAPATCASIANMSISVTTLPLATIAGGGVTVCENGAQPNITFTGSNSTPPYTFTYNINGGVNQTITTSGTSSTVTLPAPTSTTGAFTYTLTSVAVGSCSNPVTGSATITVSPNLTPTFTQVGPYCNGQSIPALPTTSTNSISGTWAPAINNSAISSAVTTNYTFTPTSGPGICATTANMPIVVNPNTTPLFTQLGPYCQGATPDAFPTTSNNGIAGSWSPATISTASPGSTPYTFTPTSAAPATCASIANMSISVTTLPLATIAGGGVTVCENGAQPNITFTGSNSTPPYTFTYNINGGVNQTITTSGTSSTVTLPAPTSTTGAFTYTLTSVAVGSCSNPVTGSATITVSPNLTPTFTQVGPYCNGQSIPALPTTSTNSISGTWAPAINNSAISSAVTTNYTFTPTSGPGICATTANMPIVVNPNTTPLFTQLGPYCQGATPDAFPTTSNNGIAGSWSPATISTASPGSIPYTFTPTSAAPATCASIANMSISVTTLPLATIAGGGITVCENGAQPNITFTGSNSTPPYTFTYNINGGVNQTITTSGTSSTVTLPAPTSTTGAFTYTLTSVAVGSCSNPVTGSATITVSPNLTPTFNQVGPYCNGQSIPALPTTSTNSISGTWAPAINNIAISSAVTTNYTFTPTSGPGICATTANMPIVVNPNTTPLFTQLGPYCQGATPDAFPTTSNNGIAGSWSPATISTASPGSTPYTFTPTSAAPATCASIANMSISVTTLPLATIAGGGVTVCENGAQPNITFTGSNSTPPYTFTYNINGGVNQTITTSGTSSTVTLPAPTSTTGAFTYTLTSVAVGSCSNPVTGSATITVSPNLTPTFTQVGPYCNGQSIPALPTTSTNSISGTWAPAINNSAISSAVTTNYTFTPTSGPGICATTANMPIVVNPNTTPLFTQLGPYCQGATPDAFPTTSNNGIAGSWSPATISTASPGSTPYTFTPTSAAPATCASIANMSISVTTLPLATIAGGGITVCENGAQPNITFTGSNSTPPYTFTYNINGGANQTVTTSGTSSTVTLPAPTSTTGAFTYTLTSVAVGSCSNPVTGSATITVSPNLTPTFNQVGPYCNGQSIPALPTTSTNSISGTWAPAINNIAISSAVTTNYTFTPTSGPGICATTANMPIVVNPNTTPLFTQLGPYCQGATPDAFPTTSNNGIAGSWSPATISTASPGSTPYTFTPTSAAPATCASIANMSISVTTLPLATIAGGGVTVCENGAQPNITFTGSNSTPPYTFTYNINGGVNQTITTSGTSSTVTLPAPTSTTGAFTYTLTSVAVGSCSNPVTGSATITVSPNLTPTFTQVGPYCNGQSIPALPTTSTNSISGTWAPAINNSAISSAVTTNYTFTPTSGPGICATTANMPIVVNPNTTPLFTQLGPYCQGATPDAFPTTSNNGIAGSWSPATISTASPGSTPYTFTPTSAAPATCASIANMSISVTTLPLATIAGGGVTVCENGAQPNITFTGSNSTPPYTFTYNINGGVNQTITTSGTSSTVTLPAPTSTTGAFTYTLTSVAVGSCSNPVTGSATITVSPNLTPTFTQVGPYCNGQSIPALPTTSTNSISGTWAPAINNSAISSAVTTNYTFTPTSGPGICATTANMPIVVNPNTTPLFTQLGPYCQGATPDAFPTTSNNGIAGSWSPATISTASPGSTPYTFTPTSAAPATCASIANMSISVTTLPLATIAGGGITVCENGAQPNITFTGSNSTPPYTFTYNINGGVNQTITTSGTSSTVTLPAPTSTTGAFTYTLTSVAVGSCSNPISNNNTATITVSPNLTPTFNQVGPYCNGQSIPALTTTSTNSISGTWAPAINNSAISSAVTTNYTFTPTSGPGICATTTNMPIVVNPNTTPLFTQLGPYCQGATPDAFPTTSNNGIAGSWSPAAISAASPGSTPYTFSPTSSAPNACATIANMSISVTTLPLATIGGTTTLCQNATPPSITFTGSNSTPPYTFTYTINGGAPQTVTTSGTNSSVTVAAPTSIPGSYSFNLNSVTVGNCSNPINTNNTAIITVFENPTIVMPNQIICGGNPITINPNVTPIGGQYLWTGPLVNNLTSNSITVSPTNNSSYSLNYTLDGCSTNQSVTINVIQNPAASVSPQTICFGDTVVLVAGPNGASYSWTGNNIIGPTNLQQIQVNPSSTTTYTVTIQIDGCATSSTTALVTVNPIPTVDAAPEIQSICNGEIATISSTVNPGGGTYQWQGSTVNGQSTATISINPVLVNPTVTETFQYILTYSANGCTGIKDTVEVEVKPKPVISVNDLIICSGVSDTMEANPNLPGGTYYWSTGITGLLDSSIIVSHITNPPNQITTFNYSAWYVLNGCSSDTIPSVVTVSPIPVLTTANPLPICSGTALNILLTSNTAGSTFSWSASANPNVTGESTTAQATNTINDLLIITPTPGIETVYYNVINSFNGCSNTFQLSVVVNPAPFINTINDIICSGGSFDTIPNPIASGNFIPSGTTYSWSVAANNSVLNETGSVNQNPNIFNSGPLTSSSITNTNLAYSVIPTSGNCIGSTFNLNITVTPTPSISNQLGSICSGNFPTITALPGDVIPPTTLYTWSIVADNPNINGQSNQGVGVSDLSNQVLVNQTNIPQSLTYSITPSSGPCPGSPFTLTVTVNPGPSIDTALYTICSGNSLTVTLGQGNDIITVGTTFIWNVMPNTNITGQTSNNIPSPNFFTGTLQNFQSVNDTLEYWLTPTGPANQNPQCNGSPFPVFVIVKPTPNLSNTLLNDICSGTSFTYDPNQNLTPSSIYNANTVLTWTVTPNLNVSGWTNSVGTNNPTITQILTNLTNTVQTVVYNATANDTLSLCSSTVFSVTVNVQPTPLIQSQTASVCSGNPFVITPSITNNQPTQIVPNGILYSWATPTSNPPNLIIGGSAQTNQASISQVLNIQPPNPPQFGSLTYIVVPSYPVSASLTCQGLPFNVTVNVNPIPIIDTAFAQPETICFGSISTLQAVALPNLIPPGGTYNWTPIAQLSNPLATTAIITTLPLNNTTTFIVTYTLPANLGSCQSQAYPVTVTVQAPPNILTITAVENEFCVGGCTNITANFVGAVAVDSVQWSTGQVTYFFPHSIQVCPNDTTTYTATAFLGGCNGNIANININVNPDPIISLQPYTDTAICVGGTLPLTIQVLNGAGNPTYQWYQNQINSNIGGTLLPSPPPFGPSYQPQPFNTAGSFYYYCVISYAPSGCGFLTTLPSEINVIADPIVQIIGQDETLCIGGTPQCLNAVISGGIGNVVQYEWNQGGSDSTFCPPNIPIGIEDYTVSVLQTGVGCSSNSIDTITVSILPDPIITIIGITAACEGAIIPLSTIVTGGIGNVVQYEWQEANPIGSPYLPIVNSNSNNYTTLPLLNDVGYSVSIIQSGNGCEDTTTHTIMIYDDPELELIGSPYSCLGEETSITANILGGTPSSTNSLTWYAYPAGVINPLIIQGPNNDLTYDFLLTGDTTIYVESVNSGFGCDLVTESITIQGLTPAVASFEVSNTIQTLIDPTFSFTNTSENATDYFWNLGECDPQAPASELFTTPTPFYNPTNQDQMEYTYGCAPGLYQIMLIAYNQGICPDTAYQVIQIQDGVSVYIPNTFTPDGDMTNQYFFPVISSIISPNTFLFSIYNRWGEEVFISKDPNEKWDGNNYITNNKCQDGVYIWKLRFIMKESGEVINKVGHVNLLR